MSVALERQYVQWNAAAIKGSATLRLNETYVKDNTGQTYELRYDPNSGTSAIVGYKEVQVKIGFDEDFGDLYRKEYQTVVLFESTPSGGTFTEQGQALLDAGNIQKIDGTTFNEQVLRNTIQNDTLNAYRKTDARRKAQGYNTPAVETSALAAGAPEPPTVAVTGTVGGPENASTTAANPDATPQPAAVPTDAGGDKTDQQPSGISQFASAATNLATEIQKAVNIENLKKATLQQPTPEALEKLSKAFATSDENITAMAGNGIQYPQDAIFGGEHSQDYVNISQWVYKPPSANTIFNPKPVSNVTDGVQRQTALAKKLGFVKLPMPNDVTDSNNVNWGEDAMNSLSAAITSAVTKNPLAVGGAAGAGALLSAATGIQGLGRLGALAAIFGNAGAFESAGELLKNPNSQMVIGSAVSSRLLSLAGVNVSPETLLARGLGVVPNQNMELLFNSPTLRTFVFNWKLAARSPGEALKINNILRFFKQGMAVKTTASQVGNSSLLLGTPNVFKLKFMTRNAAQLQGVGRIKECAITGVSVNYTPEGKWSAYDDGQPSSVLMTLRMQELEPVYASDYLNGTTPSGERRLPAAGSRDTDYDEIRFNEVGY